MVSLAELADPSDPKVGADFCNTLGLPPGMLESISPVVRIGQPVDLSAQPAGVRPDVGNAMFDGMFGSNAVENWATAQTELLNQLFGASPGEISLALPPPAEVYFRHWKFPVAGLLMVAKVRRTKFNVSEPFLLVVQFPTVMPRGYSGEVFHESSPKARLQPGHCPVPDGGKMPFIGGGRRDLRLLSLKDDALHPHALKSGYVIGFGTKAFSHALVPVSSLSDLVSATELESLIQHWSDLLSSPSGSLESDIRVDPDGPYNDEHGGIRLPVMLPLAAPLCLPAGILGHPSLGVEGMRVILQDGVNAAYYGCSSSFLNHPMVKAWLTTAAKFPDAMAIEVMGRSAVTESLRAPAVTADPETNPRQTGANNDLVAMHSSGVHDYWTAMEATLTFRLLIDTIIGTTKPHRSAGPFYRYLTTAANGLYLEDNILGPRPVELGYEVLILRPPLAAKKWREPFHLGPWTVNNSVCPSFLRDYKVQPVDPASTAPIPLRRNDNSTDPLFPTEPEFPEATAFVDPFPDDDARIRDTTNDTYFELAERRILDEIKKLGEDYDTDDLFPDNAPALAELKKKLEKHRRWPCSRRSGGRDFRSDPQKKRNPGSCADPLAFLNASAAKRARATGGPPGLDDGPPRTPPRQDGSSGIRPRNVDPLQDALYGYQADQPEDPLGKLTEHDDDTKMPADDAFEPEAAQTGLDTINPIDRLRSIFASPQGESEQNPIVIDAGTRESLIALLRRRHPVADKHGNSIPTSHRSIFDDGTVLHTATSSGSSQTTASGAATWSLHDPQTGYPTFFTFWSLLLAYREPGFVGTFNGGSKHGRPVDSDWCVFPAMLGTSVRVSFFGAEQKAIEEWVQSCASRARREAQMAQGSSTGWLQPGLYISRLTRDVLHQLRSGLWSCASYYELGAEPSKSNFTVFSMLPTRGPSATNLLPADGLKYSECIDVLRNLFFLLSLPVTQNLYKSTPGKVDSIIESTTLLATFRRFLDKLCDDPRSFNTISVRSYWETKCDARARNGLAFIVLAYVDELLSFMSMCVTHPTPTLRLVHDSNDNNNLYLAVDPTINNPVLLRSRHVQSAAHPYVHSALGMWEAIVADRFAEILRGESSAIATAPDGYVEHPKKQPPPTQQQGQGKNAGKYQTNPPSSPSRGNQETSKTQRRSNAAIPILQWGPRAPANAATSNVLTELLKNNKPNPRFPAPADGNKDARLVCFAFCLAGHNGCQRKNCNFAHVDGLSTSDKGPAAFGMITKFLEHQNVKDILVYTDTGRRLADGN